MKIVEKYDSLTQSNLTSFLSRVDRFIREDYRFFVDYYNLKRNTLESRFFDVFYQLENDCKNQLFLFQINRSLLKSTEVYLVAETLESIDSFLNTVRNLPKWLRSTKTEFRFTQTKPSLYVLKEGETLEDVSRTVLRDEDYDLGAVEIAFQNELTEDEITLEGGKIISINKKISEQKRFFQNSVAPYSEDAVCGLDIDRSFQFINDDIKTFSYNETLQQTVYILLSLKRGDNPEFANQGLDSNLLIGANRATFNFPLITRQMEEVFSTDDSILSIEPSNVAIDEDNAYIDITIQPASKSIIVSRITI